MSTTSTQVAKALKAVCVLLVLWPTSLAAIAFAFSLNRDELGRFPFDDQTQGIHSVLFSTTVCALLAAVNNSFFASLSWRPWTRVIAVLTGTEFAIALYSLVSFNLPKDESFNASFFFAEYNLVNLDFRDWPTDRSHVLVARLRDFYKAIQKS